MIYSGVICTAKSNWGGDDRLSEEAMKQLAEQAPGLPVNYEFRHDQNAGIVKDAHVDERGVVVDVDIKSIDLIERPLFVVPSIMIQRSHIDGDDVRVMDEVKLNELGLTPYPADPEVKKLEKKDEQSDNSRTNPSNETE